MLWEGDENALTGGRGALSTNEKEAIRKFDPRWEPFFTILKHPLKLDTKVCDKIHYRQNQLPENMVKLCLYYNER